MEDKNIKINLFIKQLNKSNALGYNKQYVASHADYNFKWFKLQNVPILYYFSQIST